MYIYSKTAVSVYFDNKRERKTQVALPTDFCIYYLNYTYIYKYRIEIMSSLT